MNINKTITAKPVQQRDAKNPLLYLQYAAQKKLKWKNVKAASGAGRALTPIITTPGVNTFPRQSGYVHMWQKLAVISL